MWTVVCLAVFFILTLAAVIALQGVFFHVKDSEMQGKVINRVPAELIEMREEQLALLARYRWIDREAGIAAVPIDRAMELVVQGEGDPGEER